MNNKIIYGERKLKNKSKIINETTESSNNKESTTEELLNILNNDKQQQQQYNNISNSHSTGMFGNQQQPQHNNTQYINEYIHESIPLNMDNNNMPQQTNQYNRPTALAGTEVAEELQLAEILEVLFSKGVRLEHLKKLASFPQAKISMLLNML